MRFILFLSGIFILISCSSEQTAGMRKSFDGKFTLTPAESALLCFDRYAELKTKKSEKQAVLKTLKNLDLYNKNNSLALIVSNSKTERAKLFIQQHKEELLLEENLSFIWQKRDRSSLLFLKDLEKSIEIGSLVLSVKQEDSATVIQFAPFAKRILSGFTMKHLNRPILLEINDQLITTVKSFGKLENGILKIDNY